MKRLRAIVAAEQQQPATFAVAKRGLITIATRRYLVGDLLRAHDIANNLWLSSSPSDVRVAAWKLMYLIERRPAPPVSDSHVVTIIATGGRDHRRFERWLRVTILEQHDWIIDCTTTYEPTEISPRRLYETARMRFMVRSQDDKPRLLTTLRQTNSTYPTETWQLERLTHL